MQKVFNTVPFVLKKNSYSVEIIDPLSANILDLDVISDHYEPIIPTVIDHIWGFLTGESATEYYKIILCIFVAQ